MKIFSFLLLSHSALAHFNTLLQILIYIFYSHLLRVCGPRVGCNPPTVTARVRVPADAIVLLACRRCCVSTLTESVTYATLHIHMFFSKINAKQGILISTKENNVRNKVHKEHFLKVTLTKAIIAVSMVDLGSTIIFFCYFC